MLRLVACVIPVVAFLTACDSRNRSPATDLTLVAVNPSVGRAAFHIQCAPVGGDIAQPARACAAIATAPTLITSPKPFTCAGGTFSWWDITIIGRLRRRAVHTRVSTCWTPQMALIRRLGIGSSLEDHLLTRRSRTILPGSTQTFPPGALRPADIVRCTILGHQLEDGVPDNFGASSEGYGGKNITTVTLTVTHHRDGSVTASCHTGSA